MCLFKIFFPWHGQFYWDQRHWVLRDLHCVWPKCCFSDVKGNNLPNSTFSFQSHPLPSNDVCLTVFLLAVVSVDCFRFFFTSSTSTTFRMTLLYCHATWHPNGIYTTVPLFPHNICSLDLHLVPNIASSHEMGACHRRTSLRKKLVTGLSPTILPRSARAQVSPTLSRPPAFQAQLPLLFLCPPLCFLLLLTVALMRLSDIDTLKHC